MMLNKGFQLIATAPNSVARLRELVLTLAVQGKLMLQEAEDEPASAQLERIRAQKNQLIARGEMRRDKSLPEIRDEEIPFELPETWTWVRLGEIANYGATTKAGVISEEMWVLDLEDIEKDTSKLLRRVRFCERKSLSTKNAFLKNDILYCKLRPYLNKVLVADEDGVCTTEIVPIRCYGDCDSRYVRLALKSPYFLSYVNAKSYGMKMPRLGTEDGRMAIFPLAPLAEQARIASRVDELLSLIDELEIRGQLEAQRHAQLTTTLFDALAASESSHALAENWSRVAAHFDLLLDRPEAVDLLQRAVGRMAVRGLLVPQDPTDVPAKALLAEIQVRKALLVAEGKIKQEKELPVIREDDAPFELPDGWAWARFPELGEFGRGKSKHRPRNDPTLFSPGVYPLIQTGDVARADRVIERFNAQYSESGLAQSKLWPAGTLCITIAANIADSALLGFDACFPDSVVGFVPVGELVDARYLLTFIETAKDDLTAFAPSTAQKNINLEILNNVLIPVPPRNEMLRIVARVEELRNLCSALRARLTARQTCQAHFAEAVVGQAASTAPLVAHTDDLAAAA